MKVLFSMSKVSINTIDMKSCFSSFLLINDTFGLSFQSSQRNHTHKASKLQRFYCVCWYGMGKIKMGQKIPSLQQVVFMDIELQGIKPISD